MMLWLAQFFPDEDWARTQKARCLAMLDQMWVEAGYFCREPRAHHVKFAFTNYGVSVGLQAMNAMPDRIQRLQAFFETYRSGAEYDREAITHVMACSSHFPGYLFDVLADTSTKSSMVFATSSRVAGNVFSAFMVVRV